MTDDRNKSSSGSESKPRPTARDVPFTRGAGSESEPAPRGQRPAQLPRDPTYEAELAQVELAVLRDPQPRDDPSTKQGGRVARAASLVQPTESVTPDSPGARLSRRPTVPNPNPEVDPALSPSGRAVASGTLLSVGAVDPRGKTERTLETPRMFISQVQGTEAYFKPRQAPAVTVHQTLETETVKLSDSIDPRRAQTIPRLDCAALAQLAGSGAEPDSDAPVEVSQQPSSLNVPSAQSQDWNQEQWDAEDESLRSGGDGQIHASLSPFRDQEASSFSLEGTPTRPEPLAARRQSDAPAAPPSGTPDTSTVPTHRDLPVHRIEASQPPPPPAGMVTMPPHSQRFDRASEGPTTASIAAEEPERRTAWLNYAAFLAALLLAIVIGLYITRSPDQPATQPAPPAAKVDAKAPVELKQPERAPAPAPSPIRAQTPLDEAPRTAAPSRPQAAPAAPPQKAPAVAAPAAPAPHKPTSKTPRETIF